MTGRNNERFQLVLLLITSRLKCWWRITGVLVLHARGCLSNWRCRYHGWRHSWNGKSCCCCCCCFVQIEDLFKIGRGPVEVETVTAGWTLKWWSTVGSWKERNLDMTLKINEELYNVGLALISVILYKPLFILYAIFYSEMFMYIIIKGYTQCEV